LLEGRLSPVAQKIESCMERYAKYEGENPLKAKAALLSAMVLLKGAMGAVSGAGAGVGGVVAGFGAGVLKGGGDEMRGVAVDYVAGEYISAAVNKGIETVFPVFISLDSTLNPQQAAILGMALAAVTLSSHEFSSFAKSLKTADLSGLKIADGKLDGTVGFKSEFKGGHTKNGVIDSGAIDSKIDMKHIEVPLTKKKITEYLEKGIYSSSEDLVKDFNSVGLLPKGRSPDGRFMEFSDKSGNIRVKIHPADKVTRYEHIHVYDKFGNALDINLNKVDKRDSAAHIPFKKE
jgi:hypothetical protein